MSLRLSDLEIWKKGRVFRNEISALAKSLPKEEKFRLADQIIRSSRSITANIAEGHGRFHYQENMKYCRMARGSNTETFDHLTVALDEGYINEEKYNQLADLSEEINRMINGYITYLQKKKDDK